MFARACRLALQAAFLLAVSAAPALAGDLAERQILGFSADGRFFAFEQHGVRDGSGFPYSDIFVIDTRTDEWVPGTPVHKTIESDGATAEAATAAALKTAAPFLTGIKPRGLVAASNPPTETSANPHLVEFFNNAEIPPFETAQTSRYELRLEEIAYPENQFVDGDIKGFRLLLRQSQGGHGDGLAQASEYKLTLHEDGTTLPLPRQRAFGYRINDVLIYRGVLVVLVMVETHGFETPDGRYIAVTRTCDITEPSQLDCRK